MKSPIEIFRGRAPFVATKVIQLLCLSCKKALVHLQDVTMIQSRTGGYVHTFCLDAYLSRHPSFSVHRLNFFLNQGNCLVPVEPSAPVAPSEVEVVPVSQPLEIVLEEDDCKYPIILPPLEDDIMPPLENKDGVLSTFSPSGEILPLFPEVNPVQPDCELPEQADLGRVSMGLSGSPSPVGRPELVTGGVDPVLLSGSGDVVVDITGSHGPGCNCRMLSNRDGREERLCANADFILPSMFTWGLTDRHMQFQYIQDVWGLVSFIKTTTVKLPCSLVNELVMWGALHPRTADGFSTMLIRCGELLREVDEPACVLSEWSLLAPYAAWYILRNDGRYNYLHRYVRGEYCSPCRFGSWVCCFLFAVLLLLTVVLVMHGYKLF